MNELELRQSVLNACNEMVKHKLIARTWGNVSVRLNDTQFIITPSGLDYALTKPEDLVVVNIEDCTYDKAQRKPSSEKMVHALAYKYHKDVNFIIHTHQPYASAICAEQENVTLSNGKTLPCAKYGLSGTKTLAENVGKVYQDYPKCDCFLMANHGCIILGTDEKETIDKAIELEKECTHLFNQRVTEIKETSKAYLDDYAQMMPPMKDEDEEAIRLVTEKNNLAASYVKKASPINPIISALEHFVYQKKYSKMRKS